MFFYKEVKIKMRIKTLYILILLFVSSIMLLIACKKIEIQEPDPNANIDYKCKDIDTFPEVPNLDFESWTLSTTRKYYIPDPECFWTTPNKSADLIIGNIRPPVTTFRVGHDSAYEGKYAVMMKTGTFKLGGSTLITSGTVATGTFKPNVNDPLNSIRFGQPFSRKIKKVTGMYKYISVQGDSCGMYCYQMKDKDTICFDRFISSETKRNWTEFTLEPVYQSDQIPDKLVLYWASSENGDELEGQKGSTLYIDAVKIEYYP